MSDAPDITESLVQMGEPKQRPAFVAAGVGGRFDQSTRSGIPALWPKLIAKLPLPGQRGYETYGLCWGQNAAQGAFNYMAGLEVAADAVLPEGVDRLEVPAQTYLVHRLTLSGAALHPQMVAATMDIWRGRLAKAGFRPAGGPDFELYPDDFDSDRPGSWVEFWIPVEG